MSYKEVLNKGLKRAYEFTIASADFNTKLESKIEEVKKSVKIDGFRPCLLYTSPSPRDKRQSRMPSSA